jgi:Na+-translocating ferredoxin:NAD+ oxidoreductase RnfC subunit
MRLIDKMLEQLEDEVEGARDYAEKYVECKARGNMSRANRYKEMAHDELKHATFLKEMDIADIDELKKVYPMTDEEQSLWEHGHKHVNDQMAMVMHILSM